MFNLVIFGAPGSGKGTQSKKLIDRYGLTHISTGEVLRSQIAAGTELGKIADSYISKGHLIPDDLMVDILASEVDRLRPTSNGFIFDGFPRTIPQADALKKMLEQRGEEVHSVIGLEVADEELMERLIKRGAESGRADDNPETIGNRLKVYHSTTSPLRDYYNKEGKYTPIHGSGQVEDIFSNIVNAIDSHPALKA
ncbi:MAG: adenylate kinase [Duncaniella sp.]|nr:adenylate kinase [Bacteroides sp.]MDE6061274.1 adenylate kinase [Duncaniella sp.]MBD5355365.1 adenylate kinase [Bacteroides sp.]MDE6431291.1 adenylate kinase [Duncaniella sp.]MDE6813587.1 adenylate kinase [Duncaniella sp.]